MTVISLPDLEPFRQQFPALVNKGYFNYGGQGPLPQVALEAIQQTFQQIQELGPFSGAAWNAVTDISNQTRAAIATELGTTPDTITLTENVSVGCNIALWGIDWQAGDHLLLTDCEHHSVIATVQELQRRFGVEVSFCPLQQTLNGGDPVDAIAHHLRPQTRLVVLSHILWNTGQVLPLGAIVAACHAYASASPIRVLVDAAQSVGVLPLQLDQLEVDFYAFTGHKWWCGPEGVGGLYVRAAVRAELHPTFIGWRGTLTDVKGYPKSWQPDGRRYEVATSAYPLYAGLGAAIALHQQWGDAQTRLQQIQQRSHLLWEELNDLPGITCLRTAPPESGLVSFQLTDSLPNKSHKHLVQFLADRQLFVRTILDPDCVRACVHYFTTAAEVECLVDAIRAFG